MSNNANNILPEGNDAERTALLRKLNDELQGNAGDFLQEGNDEDLFTADASEGLTRIKKGNVQDIVQQLDEGLVQYLKKKRRKKKEFLINR